MAVDSVLASLPTIASGAMLLREIEPDAALELAERHARPVPLALLRDAYLPGSDRASVDAVEPFDMGQIDEMRRARQPLLHHRHERVAAGDQLGILVLGEQIGGLPYGAGTIIFEFVHERSFGIAVRSPLCQI